MPPAARATSLAEAQHIAVSWCEYKLGQVEGQELQRQKSIK
jgi:hypothetical protein